MANTFNDIFKAHPGIKLWVTETGWSSFPIDCTDVKCGGDPQQRRNIDWSNVVNLIRNYKEFLKYDNTDISNTPEYIFLMSLSDTISLGTPRLGEAYGLYDDSNPPQLKIL